MSVYNIYLNSALGLLGLITAGWFIYSVIIMIASVVDYYERYLKYVQFGGLNLPKIEDYNIFKGFNLAIDSTHEGFIPRLVYIPILCAAWPIVLIGVIFVFLIESGPTLLALLGARVVSGVDRIITRIIIKRNPASSLTSTNEDLRKLAEKVLKKKSK